MTKALEHFLPDVELNLQSLKGIVTSFSEGSKPAANGQQRQDSPRPRQQPTPTVELGSPTSSPANGDVRPSKSTTSTPASHESIVTIEEIDDLHGELGWLTVDSKGHYSRSHISPARFSFLLAISYCFGLKPRTP